MEARSSGFLQPRGDGMCRKAKWLLFIGVLCWWLWGWQLVQELIGATRAEWEGGILVAEVAVVAER